MYTIYKISKSQKWRGFDNKKKLRVELSFKMLKLMYY